MRLIAIAVFLCNALACSPPSSSDADAAPAGDDGGSPDASDGSSPDVPDADTSDLPRERSCDTSFRYVPPGPVTTVELAGEWAWGTPEAMPSDGAGGYSLTKAGFNAMKAAAKAAK